MTPLHKDFEKLFRALCHGHQPWRVFADFCELSALALVNVAEHRRDREERYLKLVGAYTPDEQAVFPKLLGLTVQGLEDLDCDFLGEAFQQLELANHWKGQFFTPFALCRLMADLTLDVEDQVRERGFFTLAEPACGAGALVIAAAAALRARGLNPQACMHVTAMDIDPTAAHMAFVQLSLVGLPAHVVIGDTLRMQERECFTTLAHHLGFWDGKLRRGYALGTPAAAAAEGNAVPPAPPVVVPKPPPVPDQRGQFSLFDSPDTQRGAA